MAKNYIDNLSEEARKGLQEKAARHLADKNAARLSQHHRPGRQENYRGRQSCRALVEKLFEWYASGGISLKEAAKMDMPHAER
jgi:site-specific DNA recombinase